MAQHAAYGSLYTRTDKIDEIQSHGIARLSIRRSALEPRGQHDIPTLAELVESVTSVAHKPRSDQHNSRDYLSILEDLDAKFLGNVGKFTVSQVIFCSFSYHVYSH